MAYRHNYRTEFPTHNAYKFKIYNASPTAGFNPHQRAPILRKQVIKIPNQRPIVQQVLTKVPEPKQEIIERVVEVVKPQKEYHYQYNYSPYIPTRNITAYHPYSTYSGYFAGYGQPSIYSSGSYGLPIYAQTSPVYGQPTAAYAQPAPVYGQTSAGYAAGYALPLPLYGNQTQQLAYASYGMPNAQNNGFAQAAY